MDNVYCGNCGYFRYAYGAMGHPGFCDHPDSVVDDVNSGTYIDPPRTTRTSGNPKTINAKNNCQRWKMKKEMVPQEHSSFRKVT